MTLSAQADIPPTLLVNNHNMPVVGVAQLGLSGIPSSGVKSRAGHEGHTERAPQGAGGEV